MRLKTIHGTYVVAGGDGNILHLPEPLDKDFKSPWNKGAPPVLAPGSTEAAITKGPLAPSTLVVLPDGLVAFRRGRLYLCADPAVSELRFDRSSVGPWERFAIATADGAAVRQVVISHAISGASWVELDAVPMPFRPVQSNSIEEFLNKASSTFQINEEEYLFAPVTVRYEHLRQFQEFTGAFYSVEFCKKLINSSSINREKNKFVTLTDRSCGVIFDRGGFLTNPGFLHVGAPPKYISLKDGKYIFDFSYLDSLQEEDASIFVAYDGNYYNYYHWWVECMVNMEIAASYLGYMPALTIWNGKPELSHWQQASLKLLGIELIHRTSNASDVVRVKEVFWISQNGINYVPGFLLRRLRSRALNSIPLSSEGHKKIYIKRRNSRTIKNDAETDAALLDRGYVVIYAEDHSQLEQVEIFSSAESVIAAHGAGLTNILFMPQGAAVIELMPSAEVRTFYWLMAEKLHHRYGVLICNSVHGYLDSEMEVDVSDLNRLIVMMENHVGFLGRVSSD